MTDLPRIKLKELLDSLPEGLSPLERVIMAHDGTVHTLLSLLTATPIYINVIEQTESEGMITRDITFTIDGEVIMEANSSICINDNPPTFIEAIRRKQAGIGQIINFMDLKTSRTMNYFSINPNSSCFMPGTIGRSYTISGDCEIRINEYFHRARLIEVLGV